jgi:hypothetical protein
MVNRAANRRRERDRSRRRRAAKGALPRALYESASLTRMRPWEAAGISRRTWYRSRSDLCQTAYVRLTQLDGKLPNLALMKLAHFWRSQGAEVFFTKRAERHPNEPEYLHVYGSAIFSKSDERVAEFRRHFPQAIVGGTHNVSDRITVEGVLGLAEWEHYDYSIYPDFVASLGFTQRGCRFRCGFCAVPLLEGKPRAVNRIEDIWRGAPYPKHLHLLDNDFFGQPREQWEARIEEIRSGSFKVCFNQGINVRVIDDAAAAALASVTYMDDSFTKRRIYTAWDNVGDETRFFRGVDTLAKHRIRPKHLLVYMLIGYDKRETWSRVLYRFNRMAELGIKPYPMVYGDRSRTLPLGDAHPRIGAKTLADFQRWAVGRYYTVVPFEEYGRRVQWQPKFLSRPVNSSSCRELRPGGMDFR